MSFDLFLHCFSNGEPSGIDEGAICAAFGVPIDDDAEFSCWRLVYGPDDCCTVYYDRDDRDSTKLTGLTVNRPVADARLWDSLYQIMLLGNVVLFWPSGQGGALVAKSEVIPRLPVEIIEAFGEPDVVDRGADIVAIIEGRRSALIRRQRKWPALEKPTEAGQDAMEQATMAELEWLDGYSGQTTEELLALEGRYRTDSLVLAFEEALGQKEVRIGVDRLTEEERIVMAIEGLEREVNNGGYHQFFLNSTVEFAPFIVAALDRIGCHETAAITQRAINALGIGDTPTVEAVGAAIADDDKRRNKKLHACDQEYYQMAEDLAGSLFEFVKAHKDKIRVP